MPFSRHCPKRWLRVIPVVLGAAVGRFSAASGDPRPDALTMSADVGNTAIPGASVFDRAAGTYAITGSGENMWGTTDGFHYVWKRCAGDLVMECSVEWVGSGRNPHRKAGWMVRESLDPDAVYADAVVHGDGLTSFQYRKTKGGPTSEIQSPVRAPAKLRLERNGEIFTFSVSRKNGSFQPVGSLTVQVRDSVLAGLAVCSHDNSVSETAIFSNVRLEEKPAMAPEKRTVESTLEICDIQTLERRIVHRAREHFEAPNWSRDGGTLLVNSGGKLYTIPVKGGVPRLLDTGFATACNNDHGYSFDGEKLAVSHSPKDKSLIYVLPASGGEPRLVTPNGPSYWHGWSPDGRSLAYCAERNGEYDVYTIPSEGGAERRLTTAPGLDDGPEYTPDGEWIYFNSVRTGLMKIWRMRPDGSEQHQVTSDTLHGDWFPHPSPDGKRIVFLSYDAGVVGHPPNKDVCLRIMPLEGGEPKKLAELFGGQGTINVPSWSPDSRWIAFVSYRLL
jgi:regulation of enolase protein 1 (concanavalin A-like superfamily)